MAHSDLVKLVIDHFNEKKNQGIELTTEEATMLSVAKNMDNNKNSGHIPDKIHIKTDFEKIKADYHASSLCMAELLASCPADGLTIEQAFELYVKAKSWVDGDLFRVEREDEVFVM